MREPTPRQRQVWEAVERLGTQTAAARSLLITQGAVQSALKGYAAAMGIEGPLPGARVYPPERREQLRSAVRVPRGTGPVATLRRELAEAQMRVVRLEDRLARLEEENEELRAAAAPFARLEAKLDQLLARPAIVASSRRITDGGEGEKHQRRRLAREGRAA